MKEINAYNIFDYFEVKKIRDNNIKKYDYEAILENKIKDQKVKKYLMNAKTVGKHIEKYNFNKNIKIGFREYLSIPFDEVIFSIINSNNYLGCEILAKEKKDHIEVSFFYEDFFLKLNFPTCLKLFQKNNVIINLEEVTYNNGKYKKLYFEFLNYLKEVKKIENTILEELEDSLNDRIQYSFILFIHCLEVIYCKECIRGDVTYNRQIKLNNKKNKIKNYTIISLKRYQKDYDNNYKVNWTHGFWIAGHWRSIKQGKLGKNKNGNYEVFGKTWVIEHIRKEELGLVDKKRILK